MAIRIAVKKVSSIFSFFAGTLNFNINLNVNDTRSNSLNEKCCVASVLILSIIGSKAQIRIRSLPLQAFLILKDVFFSIMSIFVSGDG